MASIHNIGAIFRRELKAYFQSAVAYVFMVVFLVLTGFLTFSVARFYERGVADLAPFFFWHPWVYLLLVPAATMSLWAEERRSGTVELLLTMPITMTEAILGKFFAAWLFITIGVVLTFPIVITAAYLGSPDMGVVLSAYFGSILLAGAYVAVGMLTSSMSRSQVIGFVLGLLGCLLLLLAGWEPITGFFVRWAPDWLVRAIASFSFMPHYDAMQRGVIDLQDIAYYVSVMGLMIFATHIVLDNRKSA
ncbi:MAG: ABC transporter permease [Kiritimatiellia bacterium]|jgi:ABC-2 type transport system permease protein|nr:ABC transporter permease [Kiritimatiellia bacterium]MDP6631834.1 ABC transporter permease [Kiritimatiellia bacterium]MDP6809169.1 ABC transporter permease [Kiritimatiellia bacterium]